MITNKTNRVVVAGLFVAIGLILPYFTAHAFGMTLGMILLPMHIPILLCGLLCGPLYGALCGIAVPILSSVLTGMPPAYPMLPMMLVQLLAMGLISGLFYEKFKLNMYISLVSAMVAGWVLYGLALAVLMFGNSGLGASMSFTGAVVQGIPGIIIQLVLIPVIMTFIRRYWMKPAQKTQEPPIAAKPEGVLAEALKLINSGKFSCVIINNGSIVHKADGRGVSPLLKAYANQPEILKNAFVVDKIIGKAAAMILTLGQANRGYGMIMSVSGREYLERHGIKAEFGRCVDVISNRERNGICPIEQSVMDIEDPREGLSVMSATINEMMKSASSQ